MPATAPIQIDTQELESSVFDAVGHINPYSLPMSPSYWALPQLIQGKSIVHSVQTLVTYLGGTKNEDRCSQITYDSVERRRERRLLKVQLHELKEQLLDFFTVTSAELVHM